MGILYESRDLCSKQCLKQLYFLFIYNYVNYANTTWASTNKSKLEHLYRCSCNLSQRLVYTCKFLVNDMKALNVFKLNFSNVLRFMYKRKQNLNLHVFHNIFTHRTKTK